MSGSGEAPTGGIERRRDASTEPPRDVAAVSNRSAASTRPRGLSHAFDTKGHALALAEAPPPPAPARGRRVSARLSAFPLSFNAFRHLPRLAETAGRARCADHGCGREPGSPASRAAFCRLRPSAADRPRGRRHATRTGVAGHGPNDGMRCPGRTRFRAAPRGRPTRAAIRGLDRPPRAFGVLPRKAMPRRSRRHCPRVHNL